VVELALSLVLLVGAGLLIRSLARLIGTGVGFDTDRLLTATVELPAARYPEEAQRAAFYNQLAERVGTLPGVEAASAITFAPLSGLGSATSFWANDRALPPPGELPSAEIRWVHRDYHRTLGIGLVRGRSFDATDGTHAPLRVVISQALQREIWPDTDPIGRTRSMPWGDTPVAEIVGIVRDINLYGPNVSPGSVIYLNQEQQQAWNGMTLVVRTAGNPLAIVPQLRSAVRAMDANLPVYGVQTMQSRLGDSLARARFATISLGTFAAMALLLALIGIYGVMSYVTGQRVQEFGVRMAMGADRSDLIRLVLRQGVRLVAGALALGTIAALGLSRVLQGLRHGRPAHARRHGRIAGVHGARRLLAARAVREPGGSGHGDAHGMREAAAQGLPADIHRPAIDVDDALEERDRFTRLPVHGPRPGLFRGAELLRPDRHCRSAERDKHPCPAKRRQRSPRQPDAASRGPHSSLCFH
jgi:predicted permease